MTADSLEERLAGLAIEVPDAGRVTARVLASSHARRRRGFPRRIASVVALLLIAASVLYFVPAADSVLADAPIAGDLLRDAGLVGAGNRVTAVGAVATSAGYRLELVGAYADTTRTVLLIHSEPAIWLPVFTQPELRDQFGRTYNMGSASMNALTGNLVMQFDALAWPDGITGARITLYLTAVAPVTCVTAPSGNPADAVCSIGSAVAGSWTLPATLGVDEGRGLALPAPAHVGPATFRFTSIRSSAATIEIDIDVQGATADDLTQRIPNGGKGKAVFDIQLLAPSGDAVSGSYEIYGGQRGVYILFVGYRVAPGDYSLQISYRGGKVDSLLTVP
jgi:hypothetical protein